MKINWKDCKAKIFLNTDYKQFTCNDLSVISTQVCAKNNTNGKQFAAWGQCLLWAIEQIDRDIILYLQEDYFLKSKVDNDQIEKYVKLMLEDESIKCIHLTDQAVESDRVSQYENLDIVKQKQQYRVSCQAALWRKDELLRIIAPYESGWQFEKYASKRSEKIGSTYLVVNKQFVKLGKYEIIPYVFTGIMQGKWNKEVVDLFEQNDIYMDFNKRGFCNGRVKKSIWQRINYRINDWQCALRNRKLMNTLGQTT